jgi:hypothetical protein
VPYLYTHFAGGRVSRKWIKKGEPGQLTTLTEMRADARRRYLGLDGGIFDNSFRELALAILQGTSVEGHDKTGQLAAIHAFVVSYVRYVNDPNDDSEHVKLPEVVLADRYADCDGLVLLEVVLLAMLGFDVGFEAARYDSTVQGYQHVYGFVVTPDGVVYFDPTANIEAVGFKAGGAVETAAILVTGDNNAFTFGGFLESLAGTVVNVFVPGAGNPLLSDSAKRDQNKAVSKELGKTFEQGAAQLTSLYQKISAKNEATTQADVVQAQAAFDAMDEWVKENASEYVTAQWNSAAYKPAYEHDLQLYQERASANTNDTDSVSGAGTANPITSNVAASLGISQNVLLIGGLVLGVVLLPKLLR